jgi:hypothetical protein
MLVLVAYTVCSQSRCALTKGVGRKTRSSVERTIVSKIELNN